MPFVNIRIVKEVLGDDPQKSQNEISRRVADAISDVAGVPKDAVWITYEDVAAENWYVGDKTVREMWEEKES